MNSCYSLFLLVTVVFATAVAQLTGFADYNSYNSNNNIITNNQDFYTVPKYAYKYGVQDRSTGDFKQAYEVREGDITRGAYSVLQPDGVVRTVRYTVDPKGGFKASVTNTGLGYHPRRVY